MFLKFLRFLWFSEYLLSPFMLYHLSPGKTHGHTLGLLERRIHSGKDINPIEKSQWI